MKVRNALGLAVALSALVAPLAQPASAVSHGVVTFAGTFQIKPTSADVQQIVRICFSALASCPDDVASTGAAQGPAASVAPGSAHAIDGLYIVAEYTEMCGAGTGLQPGGRADLLIQVHDVLSGTWSAPVAAHWDRAGSTVVILGSGAVGAATFTPVGVPVCDAPLTVALSGVAQLTY